MDEKESSSNWLALLRRKIQRKFKRNRQKLESSTSCNDILEEEILEETPAPTVSTNLISGLSAQDCEEMKKELFKLSWYWPGLSRIAAQKILTNSQNGSFLIRDSSQKESFTLSFRTNSKTFHCRNQW